MNTLTNGKVDNDLIMQFKRYLQVTISFFVILFIISGCSNIDESKQQNNNSEDALNELTEQNEKLKKELGEKEKEIGERPNLTRDQLKETMNLTIDIFRAMENLDFEFLESIIDVNATIDRDEESFIFEQELSENEHKQHFITLDYEIFEYRFHSLENDVITVSFAEHNTAYYFEYTEENGEYFLRSLTIG